MPAARDTASRAARDTASRVSRVDSPAAIAAASEKQKEAGNTSAAVDIYASLHTFIYMCIVSSYYCVAGESVSAEVVQRWYRHLY